MSGQVLCGICIGNSPISVKHPNPVNVTAMIALVLGQLMSFNGHIVNLVTLFFVKGML